MNKKLIIRAAIKYREWMVTQSRQHPSTFEERIAGYIRTILIKSKSIEKWYQRFLNGTVRRDIPNMEVYGGIATTTIPSIGVDIRGSIQSVVSTLELMAQKGPVTPISLEKAIEEVRVINKSWKTVEFRNGELKVLITNIKLSDNTEEVSLGDFWVILDLSDPMNELYIKSVGEVESRRGYYHPHINNEKLCEGKGEELITNALCQGRLEDFFRIIEATLRTYNEESPHERLHDWYNPDHEGKFHCEGCDEWVHVESSYYCESCSTERCEDCNEGGGNCKECEDWRCGECIYYCNSCKELVCHNCKNSCKSCSNNYCSSCSEECVSCEINYCGECLNSCYNCGSAICNECVDECDLCDDTYCSRCISENCNDCNKNICADCQDTCEHCGIIRCDSCESEHNCLSIEV